MAFLFYVAPNNSVYRTTLLSSTPIASLAIPNTIASSSHDHLCATTCYKNDNKTVQSFLAFQSVGGEVCIFQGLFSLQSVRNVTDVDQGLNNASSWTEVTQSLRSCSPNSTFGVPLGCKCSIEGPRSNWVAFGGSNPAVFFTFYDPHANANNSLIKVRYNETKPGFECGLFSILHPYYIIILTRTETTGFYSPNIDRNFIPDPVAVQSSDFALTGLTDLDSLTMAGFWVNYTNLSSYVASNEVSAIYNFPSLNATLPSSRLATLQASNGTSYIYVYYAEDQEQVAEVYFDSSVSEWVHSSINLTSLNNQSAISFR